MKFFASLVNRLPFLRETMYAPPDQKPRRLMMSMSTMSMGNNHRKYEIMLDKSRQSEGISSPKNPLYSYCMVGLLSLLFPRAAIFLLIVAALFSRYIDYMRNLSNSF